MGASIAGRVTGPPEPAPPGSVDALQCFNASIDALPDRSPPPGLEGPGPLPIAHTHPPRPPVPAAAIGTDAEKEGQAQGRGAWGFCEVCQTPLGRRDAPNGRKRFCSHDCKKAARGQRLAKPCEICGAPCRDPGNHTCGRDCAKIWRQRHAPGVYSEELAAKVRALWDQGLTQGEIARRVGVTPNSIAGFRKRHLGDRPTRPSPIKPRAAKPRAAGKFGLICQPEGADRTQPGRYCSAHPEIRWHPRDWRCQAAA